MVNKLPNILITGTPGVGKSTLGSEVAEQTGMELISVSDLAKENSLYDGYDEQLQSYIIDEDKVIDELEDPIAEHGKIVDYHGSSFFPERFFDGVFVLKCDNTILYDRLAARGYSASKIQENVECEIMNVLVDEAQESYKSDIIQQLQNDTTDHMENNIDTIVNWVSEWQNKNNVPGSDGSDYEMQEE